ncbi:MAG: hypothetical protein QNI91_05640 [Arenicellales bacterium]|nr:hypothetical protein [Arenicellales bacterium]
MLAHYANITVNEQTKNLTLKQTKTARFRELVTWWADRLGRHQVPLIDNTDNINDFLGPDAVHHDLIQNVVRSVYRANNCGHLDACILLEETFTALGQVRVALIDSAQADVDQINLLDNIGWQTRQYFGLEPETSSPTPKLDAQPSDAKIVSFSNTGYKLLVTRD